jgi:hypothetical protein
MSTLTPKNIEIKPTFVVAPQQQQPQSLNPFAPPQLSKLSPGQDPLRMREAQQLLQRLQSILIEGQTPGTELVSDTIMKSEEILNKLSTQPDLDWQTRKTIEDISMLLLSARRLGRNKGVADRLQRIADETQKAYAANRGSGVEMSDVAKDTLEWVSNWRPLFYLFSSSRDFRKLILDTTKIVRSIAYRYAFTDENAQRFKEGEHVKEIAKDVKDDLKEDVKEQGTPDMSDDEWERLQEDVQRVLCLLVREPSYRQGVERLFALLDLFQKSIAELPTNALPEDIHIRRAVVGTEELVASFSGRETLDEFKYHLRNFIMKIKQNQNLYGYLIELKEFILKAKSEEEIRSNEFKEQSKELAKRGRNLMREFKEEDLNPLLQVVDEMVENIKNDEFLRVLRHQAGVVQSDLSFIDSEGTIQIDMDMLSKLQSVLLPVLADALKYIPVPRIYSCDKNREFWLDKIVLCSYDIIPENIRFHLESDSELSLRDIELKETQTILVIELNRLLTEIKNVEFFYHKKTFPELEDSGFVTFRERGQGSRLVITYNVVQGPEDKLPRIVEGKATFDISNLEIEFDTNTLSHPVLVPMLTSMFKLQIKQQIEHQVEKNLTNWMNNLGDMITNAVAQTNRPFMSGWEAARKAIKSSHLAQVYENRREKLE